MTRRTVAQILKQAAFSYLLRKGFSCFGELGTEAWGKRRADVIAVNLKSKIVIAEVKSCVADYSTDTKWKLYIPKCNRMYFIFTEPTFDKLKARLKIDLKDTGVGVLVLNPVTGYLDSRMSGKDKLMSRKNKFQMLTRMAWRAGDASKANSRRVRQFLNTAIDLARYPELSKVLGTTITVEEDL